MSLAILAAKALSVTPPGPPVLGQLYKGGYYAGNINDGGTIYMVLMSPPVGASGLEYFGYYRSAAVDIGTNSRTNGPANFAAMVASGWCPGAEYVASLTTNGYSDWYIPAVDEMQVMMACFKPSTVSTIGGARAVNCGGGVMGQNDNSVPPFAGNTGALPAQTPFVDFRTSPLGLVYPIYWSSTQAVGAGAASTAMGAFSDTQDQYAFTSTNDSRGIRPIRRELYVP